MTTARYIVGDVFDVMAGLPDGSVDIRALIPFLALIGLAIALGDTQP